MCGRLVALQVVLVCSELLTYEYDSNLSKVNSSVKKTLNVNYTILPFKADFFSFDNTLWIQANVVSRVMKPPSLCWSQKKRWAAGGWMVSWLKIKPLCGSILQAWTCQIFSFAENPRWSRVWQQQYLIKSKYCPTLWNFPTTNYQIYCKIDLRLRHIFKYLRS